jgi:hypothetical protein
MVISYDIPTAAASVPMLRVSVALSKVEGFCRYSMQFSILGYPERTAE